jgi:predicted nucleic acid-binding protein
MVLETAIKGSADYVVTRDDDINVDMEIKEEMKKHGIKILTVSKFLELLAR